MSLTISELRKSFTYPEEGGSLEVLKGLNCTVKEGETVAILGQSGSGKSTLLSLIAGLDFPDSGSVSIANENISVMPEESLTGFRAKNIGIIFQQFHLMPHLTALENVSLPLEISGDLNAMEKAREALKMVELEPRLNHFPHQLSGGECQRVAIARAFVVRPALLLADEPTGNLDNKTGEHVSGQLFDLVKSTGMTLVLVTHNEELAAQCDRQLYLKEGLIE